MRSVTVRDLQRTLRMRVAECQKWPVIVTRRGHPAAVMIGVEGMDREQVLLKTDDSFWRLLQRRRKEKAAPLAAVNRRLGIR